MLNNLEAVNYEVLFLVYKVITLKNKTIFQVITLKYIANYQVITLIIRKKLKSGLETNNLLLWIVCFAARR